MKFRSFNKYSLVTFSKNDDCLFVFDQQNKMNYLYNFLIDSEIKFKAEYTVHSAVFSRDSKYLAILLIDVKTCDFIKLQVYDTKGFQLIKQINLKDYIKKPFSTFTKMQFINDTVIMSFVYLDATGSILMTVGIHGADEVRSRVFENGIIQSVFVNEKNIVLLFAESKGKLAQIKKLWTISLKDLNDLKDITANLFNNTFRILSESYSCLNNSILVLLYEKSFFKKTTRKRNLYSFDITNEKLNFTSKIALTRKFFMPLQIIGDTGCYVGKCKSGKFSICSLDGCKEVADFVVEKDGLIISWGDISINLIKALQPIFCKNEVLENFVFSNTAKYGVLQTSKKTYVFRLDDKIGTNQGTINQVSIRGGINQGTVL